MAAFYDSPRWSVEILDCSMPMTFDQSKCGSVAKACRDTGMRFYVSDAHWKDQCANGSCCGLGEGWNYSRGQLTEALIRAKKAGTVRWDEVEVGIPECFKTISAARAHFLNIARVSGGYGQFVIICGIFGTTLTIPGVRTDISMACCGQRE